MKAISAILVAVAVILIIVAAFSLAAGVLFKVMGYGNPNPAPVANFSITPSAFLRFTNTALYFSIAFLLVRVVCQKSDGEGG